MTAQWHVDGPAVAGAPTLDAVFQSVMTAQQIRGASVAIASGRTIYAKRAYTWAEPGSPITTTTTTFRLASVSKVFTAAAVQRLANGRVIDLEAAVFGYLGLLDPGPHETRKDGITIAQCATSLSGMPHDYGTAGSTLRDLSIGLGHDASIAEQAAHMYSAVPLQFPPGLPPAGTGDTGYSNTAFDVLAAVIEKATGMRFVDYLVRRVAGAMGLRDVAGARTARDARLAGEVDGYDGTGAMLPSQLDLSPSATEVDVYGGDFFLEPRPASGGLLASPASVARFIDQHNVYGLGGRSGGTRYGTFVGSSAGATSTMTPAGRWDFAWATNREIANSAKDQLTSGITSYLATFGAGLIGSPFDVDEGFSARGVLLLGGFRTQHELNAMSYEDMRNTLIVEMSEHSNQPVSYEDMRNTLIVEMSDPTSPNGKARTPPMVVARRRSVLRRRNLPAIVSVSFHNHTNFANTLTVLAAQSACLAARASHSAGSAAWELACEPTRFGVRDFAVRWAIVPVAARDRR